MIKSLHISNYALIESVHIDFTPGLNIITGETGAGKSIMLGALGLILGDRADMQAISDKTKKSVIEATFRIASTTLFQNWFSENDYDWDEDGLVTLRREIAGSRSRAFINDTPVTLDKMQWLASRLVDIHSQHQNALLSDPEFQLDILDALAGNQSLKQEFVVAYKEYKRTLKEFHDTKRRIQKNRTDEDFIRFQLEQLEQLDLQENEKEELEHERDTISELAEIKTEIEGAATILSAGETNILDLMELLSEHITSVSHIFSPEDKIEDRIEAIKIELTDISETINSHNDNLHGNSGELEEIDNRLRRIAELEERHSVDSANDLIAIQQNLRLQLEELEGATIVLSDLEKKARKAKTAARDIAHKLSESRKVQAMWLEQTLRETARPLGMTNLQVQVEVAPTDLSITGADRVEFLFSFNKNQKLMPVKGAASGGEISRLMLSLKAVIAKTMSLPTIIFDEVDTGVSGDVANRMGQMMQDISNVMQVIAITHLPQVAAKGVTHFKVYKYDDEQSTHTNIRQLNPDDRISELALMLSGDKDNKAARQTATELIVTSKK